MRNLSYPKYNLCVQLVNMFMNKKMLPAAKEPKIKLSSDSPHLNGLHNTKTHHQFLETS